MAQDYSTWMSTSQIQAKQLIDIVIPGTHDSATYALTPALSDISYSDIQFLWNLNDGSAPQNGSYPWQDSTQYVGDYAYRYVMSIANSSGQSQDQSIYDQLVGGIRYFDLRIYYDQQQNGIYAQHALRGPSLEDMLGQIAQYLKDYSGNELIFIELSHTEFAGTNHPQEVADMITSILDADSISTLGVQNVETTPFDMNDAGKMTLGDICQTGSKVVFLNTDTDYQYPHTVLSTDGFKNSGRFDSNPSGVDTLKDLSSDEASGLNGSAGNMYQILWTLTAQPSDIANGAIQCFMADNSGMILQGLANEANNALEGFLNDHAGAHFNLISVDWYEHSTAQTAVDIAVGLSSS